MAFCSQQPLSIAAAAAKLPKISSDSPGADDEDDRPELEDLIYLGSCEASFEYDGSPPGSPSQRSQGPMPFSQSSVTEILERALSASNRTSTSSPENLESNKNATCNNLEYPSDADQVKSKGVYQNPTIDSVLKPSPDPKVSTNPSTSISLETTGANSEGQNITDMSEACSTTSSYCDEKENVASPVRKSTVENSCKPDAQTPSIATPETCTREIDNTTETLSACMVDPALKPDSAVSPASSLRGEVEVSLQEEAVAQPNLECTTPVLKARRPAKRPSWVKSRIQVLEEHSSPSGSIGSPRFYRTKSPRYSGGGKKVQLDALPTSPFPTASTPSALEDSTGQGKATASEESILFSTNKTEATKCNETSMVCGQLGKPETEVSAENLKECTIMTETMSDRILGDGQETKVKSDISIASTTMNDSTFDSIPSEASVPTRHKDEAFTIRPKEKANSETTPAQYNKDYAEITETKAQNDFSKETAVMTKTMFDCILGDGEESKMKSDLCKGGAVMTKEVLVGSQRLHRTKSPRCSGGKKKVQSDAPTTSPSTTASTPIALEDSTGQGKATASEEPIILSTNKTEATKCNETSTVCGQIGKSETEVSTEIVKEGTIMTETMFDRILGDGQETKVKSDISKISMTINDSTFDSIPSEASVPTRHKGTTSRDEACTIRPKEKANSETTPAQYNKDYAEITETKAQNDFSTETAVTTNTMFDCILGDDEESKMKSDLCKGGALMTKEVLVGSQRLHRTKSPRYSGGKKKVQSDTPTSSPSTTASTPSALEDSIGQGKATASEEPIILSTNKTEATKCNEKSMVCGQKGKSETEVSTENLKEGTIMTETMFDRILEDGQETKVNSDISITSTTINDSTFDSIPSETSVPTRHKVTTSRDEACTIRPKEKANSETTPAQYNKDAAEITETKAQNGVSKETAVMSKTMFDYILGDGEESKMKSDLSKGGFIMTKEMLEYILGDIGEAEIVHGAPRSSVNTKSATSVRPPEGSPAPALEIAVDPSPRSAPIRQRKRDQASSNSQKKKQSDTCFKKIDVGDNEMSAASQLLPAPKESPLSKSSPDRLMSQNGSLDQARVVTSDALASTRPKNAWTGFPRNMLVLLSTLFIVGVILFFHLEQCGLGVREMVDHANAFGVHNKSAGRIQEESCMVETKPKKGPIANLLKKIQQDGEKPRRKNPILSLFRRRGGKGKNGNTH